MLKKCHFYSPNSNSPRKVISHVSMYEVTKIDFVIVLICHLLINHRRTVDLLLLPFYTIFLLHILGNAFDFILPFCSALNLLLLPESLSTFRHAMWPSTSLFIFIHSLSHIQKHTQKPTPNSKTRETYNVDLHRSKLLCHGKCKSMHDVMYIHNLTYYMGKIK